MSDAYYSKRFSAQELDILRQQASALRASGVRNYDIADILHVPYTIVYKLVGKMPKELRRAPGRRGGGPAPGRTKLTDEEREQRRAERTRRWSTSANASAKHDDDLDLLRHRLSAYAQAELHASTNEALTHDPSDIVAAAEAELGGVVEWNGHGLRRRATDSDEVEWRDEADVLEEWPEPRSTRYYAAYRRKVLEDRRAEALADRLGQPRHMRERISNVPLRDVPTC